VLDRFQQAFAERIAVRQASELVALGDAVKLCFRAVERLQRLSVNRSPQHERERTTQQGRKAGKRERAAERALYLYRADYALAGVQRRASRE
jgi:hypothetical protein